MLLHGTRLCVFIVLMSFFQVSESRKPILLSNSGQIIINEGEALNITCICDRPLKFIFPNNTWELRSRNYFNGWEGFQYNYYKVHTIFNDTGWYCCTYYFPTIFHSFSEKYSYNSYNSEESWVYVYVKSNKNFFVGKSNNTYLNAIVGGNVIIPCRTTSPDLKPILINDNKDEVNKTSFDPRIGFTIRNLVLEDSNSYKCLIETDNKVHTVNYELSVHGKPISSLTRTESYYPPNESTEFHCEILSNPPSNITWSFLRYPKYPSFENTTTIYLTNVTQRAASNSSYKIESMVIMPIEVSGKIKCEACNTLGCDSKTETILVSDGLGAFGIIGPRESVVRGDNIDLICAASVYNYINNFTWTVRVNQTEKPVNKTERLNLERHSTPFTYRSMLKFNNIEKSDAQDYFCTGETMNTSNQETLNPLSNRATYTLIIYDPILPFFNETNLNRTKIRYIDVITEGRNTVILQCFADGMPKPTVTWYKDNVLLKESDQYLFKYNYQELHIKYMMPHDSGKYSCRAISRLGTNETYQQITVKDTKWYTLDIILVTSISILGFILVIIVIFFTIKFHREKKMREELLVPDLIYFDGEYETPSPTTENKSLLYDKKWEFPRERLKLKEQLDSGYFGVVMKAEALQMCSNETVTTVAVKMIRQSDDATYLRALVCELKIMLHLGKHLNIVNLLGACTKNVSKGELLVILEYCSFGNLHKHLLRHRNDFIDQIDSKTGKLDLTITIVKTTVNVSNDNSAKSIIDVVQYYPETDTDSSEVNILPNCVPGSNSGQSNFCGSYKILHQNLKSICTQDLLSWAFQVARGMEYLSQKKVLHGDLAARNILLAEDNLVKICDFGLAKNMYKNYYKKRGHAPVPVKWMAIESIEDHIFSTQSDVWSFGIMLWEFFTLAKEPYPGTEAEKLYQKLIEGYRMEQPDYANREIYDIMLQCWEAKPASRPSFTNLMERIGSLLKESVKMLNIPYMDMNKKNLSTSKNNSLIMTTESDHAELSLSDYENSQFPKDRSNSLHVHVNPASSTDSENTTELSPMLKNDQDAHLNIVNVLERRAKFIRQRQIENLVVDRLMK